MTRARASRRRRTTKRALYYSNGTTGLDREGSATLMVAGGRRMTSRWWGALVWVGVFGYWRRGGGVGRPGGKGGGQLGWAAADRRIYGGARAVWDPGACCRRRPAYGFGPEGARGQGPSYIRLAGCRARDLESRREVGFGAPAPLDPDGGCRRCGRYFIRARRRGAPEQSTTARQLAGSFLVARCAGGHSPDRGGIPERHRLPCSSAGGLLRGGVDLV